MRPAILRLLIGTTALAGVGLIATAPRAQFFNQALITSGGASATPATIFVGSYAHGTSSGGVFTQTFSLPFSTSQAGRITVVAIHIVSSAGTSPTPTSITIGGTPAVVTGFSSSTRWQGFASAVVASGSPLNVVVNVSGAGCPGSCNFGAFLTSYSLYGPASATPVSSSNSTATPLSGTVSVSAGGAIIGGSHSDGNDSGITWSGITQDTFNSFSANRDSTASKAYSNLVSQSITATWTSPSNPMAVFAGWQ